MADTSLPGDGQVEPPRGRVEDQAAAPASTAEEGLAADLPAPATRVDGGASLAGAGEDVPTANAPPAQADVEPGTGEAAATGTRAGAATASEPVPTPSFTRAGHRVQARTPAWHWLLLAVLATVLVLQVLLADRARLAADAAWRPLISGLCSALGCSVPPWREPAAFAMLSRDVRPLPGVPGALLAQATFRNDARWAQAWPVLVVSLSDADGRVVGTRAFAPDEYLADHAEGLLAPGQSAQVMLRLREPDPSVVAFAFAFR